MLKFTKYAAIFLLFISSAYGSEKLICPPVDASGKLRIDPQAQMILETCIKQSPVTKNLYFNQKTHQYIASRQKLHNEIINNILANKPCVSSKPIAILTGGIPGSGKTTFIKKNFPWITAEKFIMIDADSIREKLPEYKGWNSKNTHAEVTDIVHDALKKISTPCKHNLFYDGTMSNQLFYKSFIKNLKKMGYQIYIVYVDIPLDIAIKRTQNRYLTSNRYVVENYIIKADQQSKPTFEQIKNNVDGYIEIDGLTGKITEKSMKPFPLNEGNSRNY